MPKKQSNGIPATYEQQQMMRQQRQNIATKKGKEQMAYVQGKGAAESAVKQRSQSADYSKARSGGYSGPSLSTLNDLLERAKTSGDAGRIKRVQAQISQAKKAGAK